MSTVLDVMLISSFMHMMMPPPAIMVVHPSGVPIGGADTIASHPEAVEASAVDPGDAQGGHDGDTGGSDGDGDFGDHDGGQDMLADNSDFDGGGDFGDGGGFDGGGFDGGGDY